MPRTARSIIAGHCYHVINRANLRARIFHDDADYAVFLGFMAEAQRRFSASLLAACLMPNHVQLVLQRNWSSARRIGDGAVSTGARMDIRIWCWLLCPRRFLITGPRGSTPRKPTKSW